MLLNLIEMSEGEERYIVHSHQLSGVSTVAILKPLSGRNVIVNSVVRPQTFLYVPSSLSRSVMPQHLDPCPPSKMLPPNIPLPITLVGL